MAQKESTGPCHLANSICMESNVISRLRASALREFKTQVSRIYFSRDISSSISSSMVAQAVRAADTNIRQHIDAIMSKALDSEASNYGFSMIDDEVLAHLNDLQHAIEHDVVQLNTSSLEMAATRFQPVRDAATLKLDKYRSRFVERKNLGGRSPKWEWESSLCHLVAIANSLDGLPSGPKSQAQIETLIANWFIVTTGDAPAESEIRIRAKKVVNAIKHFERAGN